ncbi:MAG: amidohydrolase [Filifactoraceae bacterium]
MDLILYNGKIYSGANFVAVEAVGVSDGIIKILGSDAEVMEFKSPETKLVDLKGKIVVPGFCDSHMHLLNYGYSKTKIDLNEAISLEDLQEKSKKFIETNNIKKGQWVLGRGWNHDNFAGEKNFPTRYDLDKISTDHPIVLTRTCGHVLVANSLALELAKISKDSPQIEGGQFDLDETGEVLGIFREHAVGLIYQNIESPSVEEIKSMMLRAFKDMNKQGITSAGSDDFEAMPDCNYEKVITAYKQLIEEDKMTVRVNEQCLIPHLDRLKEFYAKGYKTGEGNELFRIGPLKILIDGSLGARTAALNSPYEDDPGNCGITTATQEELNALVQTAHKNNCQVAIHGIGDKGMYMAFDAIENALAESPREDHRHGIVHAQVTDNTLLEKFQKIAALAYIQPIFLDYDWKIVRSRIGKDREDMAYNIKGMIDKGIHVSMGSDAPVETFSVMAGIYEAVTRKDLKGNPEGGWMPDKKITVNQALRGYTLEGAYTTFEENIKGSIDVGKLADMVVLEADILEMKPEEIKDVAVDMTILGGKIVYSA